MTRRFTLTAVVVLFALCASARADIWEDTAFAPYSEAVALYNAGELDQALVAARKGLGVWRDNVLLLTLAGEILVEKQQFGEAVVELERAVRIYPAFAEGYYRLGLAYMGLKDFPKADTALRQAINVRPDFRDAAWWLAEALVAEEKPQAAILQYRQYLKLQGGTDENAFLAIVEIHEGTGQIESAVAALEELLVVKPEPRYEKRIGVLEFNNGNYERAIPVLEKLRSEGHADADVLYCLAMSYQMQAHQKQELATAEGNTALIEEALAEKQQAVKLLKAALELDPGRIEAHYNLAVIYLETKHVRDAIKSLERTVEINPRFQKGYIELGRIYEYFMYDIDTAKFYYDLAERVAGGATTTQPTTRPTTQPASP